MQKKTPSLLQAVIVLGGFLIMAFLCNKFGIEIHLAILAAWFLAMAVGKINGHSYGEMEHALCKGIYDGMSAVLIMLVIGALVGTWISGGIVPSLIYYGLKIIHPSIFLLATLILCSITSLATGTSWGTAGTAGIAMMGIGAGLGIPAPITAGAVLSGAYFGDKLSPISDSCVLSSAMADIDVVEHVKGIMPTTFIGYALAAIAFTIAGFVLGGGVADMSQVEGVMVSLQENFNISLLSFIPMIVVIGLLILKMPSLPVITLGAGLGIVWGIVFQGLEPIKAISTAWTQLEMNTGVEFIDSLLSRGGINSMLWSIAIIIMGLGFGGLLDEVGIIKAIAQRVYPLIKNGGTLTIFTIIVGFLGCLLGSAMYVSLVLTPKIMADKYDEMKYSRRILSRNAEIGGTLTAGMVPWSDNGIYMATILGVATIEYIPYMWFNFACIVIAVIFGFTGFCMWDNKNDDKIRNSLKNQKLEEAEG